MKNHIFFVVVFVGICCDQAKPIQQTIWCALLNPVKAVLVDEFVKENNLYLKWLETLIISSI